MPKFLAALTADLLPSTAGAYVFLPATHQDYILPLIGHGSCLHSVLALFSTAKSATLCISVGSTLLVHQIYPCFDSRDHCPFDLDCKLNGSSSWLAHEMTILPHVPLHPPVHGPSQLPNSCVILCPRCARRNAPPRSIIDGLRTSAGMAKRGGGRRRAR